MVNATSLCHLTILLLSFCFMVVKCSLEPTDQFIDNPTDTKQDALTLHKRPSFFVGSRYGRSGSSSSSGSSLFATSKTRRLNVVPRNDRFFLSSRYGKRAEISTGTQLSNKPIPEQQQEQQQQQHQQQLNDMIQPYAYMSCVYTGLQNYYRCNSIDSMLFYKNTNDNDDDNYVDNDDDDENEVLSTDTTGAALFNDNNDDDNDDDTDDDNNDNVNNLDDDVKK
ncbi:RYamide isoform 1-T2 [Cochliomyia hominivorax]